MNVKKTVAGVMAGAMAVSAMATTASALEQDASERALTDGQFTLSYDLSTWAASYSDSTVILTTNYRDSEYALTRVNTDESVELGATLHKAGANYGASWGYDVQSVQLEATSVAQDENSTKTKVNELYYSKVILGKDITDNTNESYAVEDSAGLAFTLDSANNYNGIKVKFNTRDKAVKGSFIVDGFLSSDTVNGQEVRYFTTKAAAEAYKEGLAKEYEVKTVTEEVAGTADSTKDVVIYKGVDTGNEYSESEVIKNADGTYKVLRGYVRADGSDKTVYSASQVTKKDGKYYISNGSKTFTAENLKPYGTTGDFVITLEGSGKYFKDTIVNDENALTDNFYTPTLRFATYDKAVAYIENFQKQEDTAVTDPMELGDGIFITDAPSGVSGSIIYFTDGTTKLYLKDPGDTTTDVNPTTAGWFEVKEETDGAVTKAIPTTDTTVQRTKIATTGTTPRYVKLTSTDVTDFTAVPASVVNLFDAMTEGWYVKDAGGNFVLASTYFVDSTAYQTYKLGSSPVFYAKKKFDWVDVTSADAETTTKTNVQKIVDSIANAKKAKDSKGNLTREKFIEALAAATDCWTTDISSAFVYPHAASNIDGAAWRLNTLNDPASTGTVGTLPIETKSYVNNANISITTNAEAEVVEKFEDVKKTTNTTTTAGTKGTDGKYYLADKDGNKLMKPSSKVSYSFESFTVTTTLRVHSEGWDNISNYTGGTDRYTTFANGITTGSAGNTVVNFIANSEQWFQKPMKTTLATPGNVITSISSGKKSGAKYTSPSAVLNDAIANNEDVVFSFNSSNKYVDVAEEIPAITGLWAKNSDGTYDITYYGPTGDLKVAKRVKVTKVVNGVPYFKNPKLGYGYTSDPGSKVLTEKWHNEIFDQHLYRAGSFSDATYYDNDGTNGISYTGVLEGDGSPVNSSANMSVYGSTAYTTWNANLFSGGLVVNSDYTMQLSDTTAFTWGKNNLSFHWNDIKKNQRTGENTVTNYNQFLVSMLMYTPVEWYWDSLDVIVGNAVSEDVTSGEGLTDDGEEISDETVVDVAEEPVEEETFAEEDLFEEENEEDAFVEEEEEDVELDEEEDLEEDVEDEDLYVEEEEEEEAPAEEYSEDEETEEEDIFDDEETFDEEDEGDLEEETEDEIEDEDEVFDDEEGEDEEFFDEDEDEGDVEEDEGEEEVFEDEDEDEDAAEDQEEEKTETKTETKATQDVASPKTGNSPIALAVIPVALAAAAVVAKKRS